MAEYHDGASTPTKRYRYSQTGVVPLSYSDANGDYSVHSDALATPKALTNSNGTTVWSAVLGPYGQPTENQDVDGDGQQVAFNLRFPGQYHDRETGLHYNRNRTYDPATGRYLQSDPIGLDGGANAYRYANANPVNLADPNGTIACGGLCIGAAVLGAADMALSVYDAYQTYNTLSDECASAGDKSMAVAALGAGLVLPGSYGWVDDAAKSVAKSPSSAIKLNKQLGSQQQLGETGSTIAGQGSKQSFRDADRVAREHGGSAEDWVKKSSSSHEAPDGTRFETHWSENVRTGQRVEHKTKFTD
ncbi:RHS repeat-associated core domain-containing protein [Halovibrio salipaludis]|uniref:RHS repeat-associated core domain-containing protein n=1 Tax=Halovibrio salipaludis TaxID=2032626 RepID=UPI0018E9A0F5|nr:RHS repeat-associated core domain-containing protein [Halovibrio salipaludis]